jgi:hypothetical protein
MGLLNELECGIISCFNLIEALANGALKYMVLQYYYPLLFQRRLSTPCRFGQDETLNPLDDGLPRGHPSRRCAGIGSWAAMRPALERAALPRMKLASQLFHKYLF